MILLVGATGYTGQLVAAELVRLKCPIRLGARSLERLTALKQGLQSLYHQVDQLMELTVIDVGDPSSIERALAGCSVVVNCAGPFLQLGEPVLAAAVRSGVHYLDVTGEQQFVKLAYEKYGEAAARAGCGVIPACAFEYAIGDAAAALLDPRQETLWNQIKIVYSIEGIHTSRGTKKSVLKVLASPSQFGYEHGKLVKVEKTTVFSGVELAGQGKVNAFSFPAGEILMLPLHVRVESIRTLMTSSMPSFALSLLSAVGKCVARSALSNLIVDQIDKQAIGPSESMRSSSSFVIVCQGIAAGKSKTIVVRGTDPYLLTAMIASGVAKKLHFGPFRPSGPTSPSMVSGADFIQQLTAQYTQWSEVG